MVPPQKTTVTTVTVTKRLIDICLKSRKSIKYDIAVKKAFEIQNLGKSTKCINLML